MMYSVRPCMRYFVFRLPVLLVLIVCTHCAHAQVQFRKPTWQDINPASKPSIAESNQDNQVGRSADQITDSSKRGGFGLVANQQSVAPKPIVTRQNAFGVPFSINPEAGPIREVQLHVSTNKGASWSLYSRQLPTANEFPFRATADGEYWFAVKTVGSKIPEKKLTPELVIAIDSRRPNFQVDLKTDALGRLVVNWRATDENLDPRTIKVFYQSVPTWGRPNSKWQEVKLPRPDPTVKNIYQDEIAFYADTSNVSLDIRVSIADQAGNVNVVTRRYNLPRTALNPNRRSGVPNVASRTNTRSKLEIANQGSRPPSTDPYSSFTQEQKDDAASKVGMEASFDPNQSGFGQSGSLNEGGSKGRLASSANREQGWHFQGTSGFQQDFHNNRPGENEFAGSNSTQPGSVSDPGFQNPSRLASSGRTVDDTQEAFSRGSSLNRIPIGQYAKLSNSNKFELDYQVEHIQPDDISRLEIWVTDNAGQSWTLLKTDPDKQSPVGIEVDEDGIYGYRIRIQTIDGLESLQPSKGDSADVWVEVDTTRPSVKLTSIPYGRRSDAGKLIVNWRATDRRLAAKPITLFYSVNLDGPWQIVVEKLDNSGQFKWPVTDRIPRQVYLRIEAVDAAGNKSYHQTEQPIDLSGLNPRGMIRGVRPIK